MISDSFLAPILRQRAERNVLLLRSGLRDIPQANACDMTLGGFYGVPGMYQSHRVIAVDPRTGTILPYRSVKRHVLGFGKVYESAHGAGAILDYIFAVPWGDRPQKITLPPGYHVFPVQIFVEESAFEAEAREVIRKTEIELFAPVLADLDRVHKRVSWFSG